MNELNKKLSRNYHLILTYGLTNEYTIKDIYKASKIVDSMGIMIDEETLREDNLFLLENDNYFMVFKGRKSKIVIPLKYIETMFNSDITITTDKLAIYVISKTLFNDDKRLLDYFKNNYIKLN